MIITKNHQKLLYYTMQYIVKVKYSSSMKCEYNDTKYRRILWIVLENVIKIKKRKKKKKLWQENFNYRNYNYKNVVFLFNTIYSKSKNAQHG